MIEDLETKLSGAIGAAVAVTDVSPDVIQVHVPFVFADGDRLVVRLRRSSRGLEWTDIGHTMMHLSYELDLDSLDDGPRREIFESVTRRFEVEERAGEMVLGTRPETIGADLFAFSQALLEIADLRTLTRSRIRTTFRADLESLLTGSFADRLHRDWHHPEHDPDQLYAVDFLVNGLERPIAIFGVRDDANAGAATVSLLKMREWNVDLFATAVHADLGHVSGNAQARLTDAVDKQWSSLAGHESDIVTYISKEIARQSP